MAAQKKTARDPYPRHLRLWNFLYVIAHRFICRKFNITHDELNVDGPVIMIPNHVTNWDPLIVGMSLRHKQMYFVATEHIFRLGFLSKLLNFVFGPIARPKGGSSLDAVRKIMDQLKRGRSVCLFAEGEATWDGQSHPVFPATGKLVRMSGAALVTYRIEGGYLSLPRWSTKIRKGAVSCHVVNVYTPDTLKKMSPQEINEAINSDIYENAFARQKDAPVFYHSKTPAEHLERLLYLCPKCGKPGTLHTSGDRLFCSCGLETRFTGTGFFEPMVPSPDGNAFETVLQWNRWQKEALRKFVSESSGQSDAPLFSDDGLRFNRITSDHRTISLGTVKLLQFADRLRLSGQEFTLSDISEMAMVQANRLLFTVQGVYYEVISPKKDTANLRKYLDVWEANTRQETKGVL